jgi:protein-arginine deiminase
MRRHTLVLISAFALAACASEGDPDNQNPDPSNPDGGCVGSACSALPDAGVPGTPDADIPPDPTQFSFPDVHGVPNLDDDDGATMDWLQGRFPADDDYSFLTIPGVALAELGPGATVELSLTGNTQFVSVYIGSAVVVGAGGPGGTHTFDAASQDVELAIEWGDYAASATLTLTARVGGTEIASDEVELRAAPLVMNHHIQPAEHVWAMHVNDPSYNNTAFINAYQSALGSDFTAINGPSYGFDVWVQDEFEFATLIGEAGQRLDVVIDSIRNRGLDDFAEDALVGPDTITDTWGVPQQVTSYDSFGNLEASPPVTVGGVEFPFGKIYYGRVGTQGIHPQMAIFLQSQDVQAPFELPTNWLCVGHVDEYSSVVPDPSSAKGFKLLISDVPSAYALLNTLSTSASLPQYAQDHGYSTVGAILADNSLRALNEDLQADYLDPILATFKAELGLTEADIIRVPSLFEHVSGCGGGVAALVPGMVNLIVANTNGQDTHLFTADPFFRSTASQAADPFIADFAARMPAGLTLHFIDNWDVYHMGLGEVHCGTNVQRTPVGQWWTDAQHLMGGTP